MKIVHVVESFGGGVYTFLVELCNSLAENNDVTIIYSKRKETPKNFKEDFRPNIKFKYVKMCRGLNPYINFKSYFLLKRILIEENPDIIHLHSSKAGFLGRFACKNNKFDMNKVFYNPHGFSFLIKDISNNRRKLYFLLEKLAAKSGGNIIGCSQGEYNEALKLTQNAIHINNGINVYEMNKKISNIKLENNYKNKIKIGTIGRITYQKNPQLFNDIASSFPNMEFVWVGDGELKNVLSSVNIRITGWLKHEKVLEELLDLDIYIMTSLWEGLPIALLEAMYLKKPSIVTNVIGNNDVIINSENGFIANCLEEFIKYINLLLGEEKLREEISKNAYFDVVNNYNSEKMVGNYINIYINYMDENKNGELNV